MKLILNKLSILIVIIFSLFVSNGAFAQNNGSPSKPLVRTVVALTGNVINEVTRAPIATFLVVNDENGKKVFATRSNAAENGYYYITGLLPGHKYSITINQTGYFKDRFDLDIPNTDMYQEISKDLLVKPMIKDTKIKIPVPPFELNKTKLRYGSDYMLKELSKTLINNPEVKFEVLCYPDNNDDKKENKKFTEDRCQSISDFLTQNGIDASRITIKGSSSTDPQNPPPVTKTAKGKRYIGTSYIVVVDF